MCRALTSNTICQDEHEAIQKSREDPDSPITWDEYKSMSFTFHVENTKILIWIHCTCFLFLHPHHYKILTDLL